MLSTNMQEAASQQIVETEVEPVVFQELLRWFYTDNVAEGAMEAMGEYLLLAANKYGCEPLKQMCELKLCHDLTVENAAARLVLSEQAEAEQLKEACLDFIRGHGAEVMKTAGWADVTAHNGGKLVVDLFAVMAGVHPRGKKRRADDAGLVPTKRSTATKLAAVDDMRVPELRAELSKRSLNTSGLKAQLVERLKAAIEEEGSSLSSAQAGSQSDVNLTDVTADGDTDAADPAQ